MQRDSAVESRSRSEQNLTHRRCRRMSLAKRLTVVALLIAMLPSLVLAAMPFKYCTALAGHYALEFVIGGVLHGGSHASHRDQATLAAVDDDCGQAISIAGERGCSDTELVQLAPAPFMPQVEIPLLPTLPAPIVPLPTAITQNASPSTTVDQPRPDPRISMRRTVVLRI